jgi:hypothetical protein
MKWENATYYRQQKKRTKTTCEESLLEIIREKSRDVIDEDKSFLMSLVPSFKKLNDEQKFVAKVAFLNVMRRITFCEPPCHGSNQPQFQSYSNLPGPSAHTSFIRTLPNIKISSGTHHKVCNDINTISPFKILIPNSRPVNSTLLLPTAVPQLHICRPLMETVRHL